MDRSPGLGVSWAGGTDAVGIDPGGTTGLARVSASGCRCAEVRGLGDLRTWIQGAGVVVMEDFLGAGGRAVDYRDPLLVIGAVLLICQEEGIPVVLQPPGRPTRRDHDLAARAARGRHARSAMAHLICWGRRDGRLTLE